MTESNSFTPSDPMLIASIFGGGRSPHATVRETDIPGLYDVSIDDGRELADVTLGQLRSLVWQGVTIGPPRP